MHSRLTRKHAHWQNTHSDVKHFCTKQQSEVKQKLPIYLHLQKTWKSGFRSDLLALAQRAREDTLQGFVGQSAMGFFCLWNRVPSFENAFTQDCTSTLVSMGFHPPTHSREGSALLQSSERHSEARSPDKELPTNPVSQQSLYYWGEFWCPGR